MVAEGKIRNLQTENDALKLHLKLALDSLKNPIAIPSARNSMTGSKPKEMFEDGGSPVEADKENVEMEAAEEDYSDDDEGIDVEVHEERATEMQGFMKELLKDLGMFKRKLGDDKSRFVKPLGERVN